MKTTLSIPTEIGYCKNCFRKRRDGSAYCGECQNEPERIKIYLDSWANFPLLDEVGELFPVNFNTIFTYGDTIYHDKQFSPGLIAHEITHIFQQSKTGVEKWWEQYLTDPQFRLINETEAYHNQYECYLKNNPMQAEQYLDEMSRDLSGKLYGNVIDFDHAKQLIINLYGTE
jgi:hypothetical protein